jgi:predicted extracellular nuclease
MEITMEYFIAWWNLENLFDVANSSDRPEWLQKKLKSELVGWTNTVLNNKIKQLASIISQMNNSNGPDLLGVCEVENKIVVEKLVAALAFTGRNYAVVHADTNDARGIDVAFIYDKNLFKKPARNDVFSHVVVKRNATRDIVQVNFQTKSLQKNDLVVLGNHWPSKLGGDLESEPYRIMAAETMSYWIERIYAHFEKEVPVIVMGDFNDEPFNRSVTHYALGLKDSSKVHSKRSQKPYLYNLMWPLQNDKSGTHYYDSWGMLDQVLVNRPLLRKENQLQLVSDSCQIFKTSDMLKSGKPRRFSRPSAGSSYDPGGFSDHLPVTVRLFES